MNNFLDALDNNTLDPFNTTDNKKPSDKCKSKVIKKVDRIINDGEFSHLVTFSGMFSGQYNLDDSAIVKMLYFKERFMTALDYDVATDYQLWLLVRQYKRKNELVPRYNQELAGHIYKRSQRLHRKFPKDRYFNKLSLNPVNYKQAEQLKLLIHKILNVHGITKNQYHELKREYHNFIICGY